jgi:hypothetical protein
MKLNFCVPEQCLFYFNNDLNMKKCVKCVLSKAGYKRKVLMRGYEWANLPKRVQAGQAGENSLGPRIWSRDKSALLLFAYFIL